MKVYGVITGYLAIVANGVDAYDADYPDLKGKWTTAKAHCVLFERRLPMQYRPVQSSGSTSDSNRDYFEPSTSDSTDLDTGEIFPENQVALRDVPFGYFSMRTSMDETVWLHDKWIEASVKSKAILASSDSYDVKLKKWNDLEPYLEHYQDGLRYQSLIIEKMYNKSKELLRETQEKKLDAIKDEADEDLENYLRVMEVLNRELKVYDNEVAGIDDRWTAMEEIQQEIIAQLEVVVNLNASRFW